MGQQNKLTFAVPVQYVGGVLSDGIFSTHLKFFSIVAEVCFSWKGARRCSLWFQLQRSCREGKRLRSLINKLPLRIILCCKVSRVKYIKNMLLSCVTCRDLQ